jgi:hypothetical protein
VIQPPKDVESAELFRRLVVVEPFQPVSFRFSAAEDIELTVKAAHSSVWAEAARLNQPAHLVASVLYTADGDKVFRNAREAGLLSQAEFRSLLTVVVEALDVIGPTMKRVDWRAWERVLVDGARSCGFESSSLAHCVDHYSTPTVYGVTPRPDRYWGLPLSKLLDGHWLVFWASREAHK